MLTYKNCCTVFMKLFAIGSNGSVKIRQKSSKPPAPKLSSAWPSRLLDPPFGIGSRWKCVCCPGANRPVLRVRQIAKSDPSHALTHQNPTSRYLSTGLSLDTENTAFE